MVPIKYDQADLSLSRWILLMFFFYFNTKFENSLLVVMSKFILRESGEGQG
jgi:hypothetical protein